FAGICSRSCWQRESRICESLRRRRSFLFRLTTGEQRLQPQSHPGEETVQPLLFDRIETAQHFFDLLPMNFEYLADYLPAAIREGDKFRPQVFRSAVAYNQAGSLQAIDNPGHARWTDQQAISQVGQSQPRQPL